MYVSTGSDYADAVYFSLIVGLDPAEILQRRRKMKVQLARYLHVGGPDEHLGWGDVEVRELRLIYEELAEIIREEKTSGLEQ